MSRLLFLFAYIAPRRIVRWTILRAATTVEPDPDKAAELTVVELLSLWDIGDKNHVRVSTNTEYRGNCSD